MIESHAVVLHGQYSLSLVLLSFFVAVAGVLVTYNIASRAKSSGGRKRVVWTGASALSLGGGTWASYFIARLSYQLPLDSSHDIVLMIISFACVVGAAAAALGLWAWKPRASWVMGLAGLLIGGGMVAMYAVGVAALDVPAALILLPSLLFVSVLTAGVVGGAVVYLIGEVKPGGDRIWASPLAISVILGMAITGEHYLFEAGLSYATDTSSPQFPLFLGLGPNVMASLVALGALLVMLVELTFAALDRRLAFFKEREAELIRLSAQRFQNLVQSSNDLIVVVDCSGRVQYVAPSSVTAISRQPEELEGTSIFDFVSGEGVEVLRAVLLSEEESAAFAFIDRVTLEVGQKDGLGNSKDFEITVCNLKEEPSVNGFVLTFHDVTERERSMRELREAKQVAEEANRLKGEFIARMNHELRTPLNGILGFSQVLAEDEEDVVSKEEYRDYARHIHSSGKLLHGLINDLLDFSKAEAGKLTITEHEVDAREIACQVMRTLLPLAGKESISLVNRMPMNLPHLYGDELRLRQILLNLVSNAVKFSSHGGIVILFAEVTPEGAFEFVVEDRGCGIPADKLDHLTDPFFQVDGSSTRQQEGTGLGLAISKMLAELHGGELLFTSEEGRGTTARLVLPKERVIEPQISEAG